MGALPADAPLRLTPEGLYCVPARAWIDPWRPVPRALLTHAHADHARPGSGAYWSAEASEGVLRSRLGAQIPLTGVPYGAELKLGDARVSFHSAGHVLGSAQILLEAGGERWLISGDYKRDPDPSCAPFTTVQADVFISEATFGLPVYRWPPTPVVAQEILNWWRQAPAIPSVLCCYAFGKAQRLLAELHAQGAREEVLLHGAIQRLMEPYRVAGIPMVPTRPLSALPRGEALAGRLILAPPSALGTPWIRRFPKVQTAFASGWMAVRGVRRRKGVGRGFVLSDHADWHSLVHTIVETGAQQVFLTHGHGDALARYLNEVLGLPATLLRSNEPGAWTRTEDFPEEGEGSAADPGSTGVPDVAEG
ncbi:MAG: ligase-associated DNA damage response exonuclease [Cyanobacteriota bacterium]|nr:ligase-associated DNA damage response exonuclease [Cyanobacteriota bacterium]